MGTLAKQSWDQKLEQVRRQAMRLDNGRYHLPVRDKQGLITPLGRWLNQQRRASRMGLLDDSQTHLLQSSGLELDPGRGRRKPGRNKVKPAQAFIAEDLNELVQSRQRFGVIYADPPWRYDNQATRAATGNHYSGLSIPEIAAIPVDQLAAKDCYLHLWTTNGFLKDALKLLDGWGFEFKSNMIWTKPQMGLGNYWRVSHETLLLGKRGNPKWKARNLMSWTKMPRTAHSAKPEIFREMIERTNDGPYLELFGRRTAPGWTVWGNQIDRNDMLNRLYLQADSSEESACREAV